jgi:hypothetical protein
MKTFKDLEFKPHPSDRGIQAIIEFDNGRSASVICAPFSYGGKNGLYELAIFHNDEIVGDVHGFLTEDEVTELLKKIQEL